MAFYTLVVHIRNVKETIIFYYKEANKRKAHLLVIYGRVGKYGRLWTPAPPEAFPARSRSSPQPSSSALSIYSPQKHQISLSSFI